MGLQFLVKTNANMGDGNTKGNVDLDWKLNSRVNILDFSRKVVSLIPSRNQGGEDRGRQRLEEVDDRMVVTRSYK